MTNLYKKKYSELVFEIAKGNAEGLENKPVLFKVRKKNKQSVFLTFPTNLEIKDNEYAKMLAIISITIDALYLKAE